MKEFQKKKIHGSGKPTTLITLNEEMNDIPALESSLSKLLPNCLPRQIKLKQENKKESF